MVIPNELLENAGLIRESGERAKDRVLCSLKEVRGLGLEPRTN